MIKFLIGSAIFALVCFEVGYRVCRLRMEKKLKDAEDLKTAMEQRYLSLRKAYLSLSMAMEEGSTPVYAPARNDNWEDDGS